MIRLSSDSKRVLIFALDEKMKSMILLIDISTHRVLGRMHILYADSSSIRDGGFLKESFNKFVTCGSNHITLWQYEGNEMVYENLEVRLEK